MEEKRVFIASFTKAYKDISLETLEINSLDQFLKSAFEDEESDFLRKKDGAFFYRAIDEKYRVIGYVSFDINQDEKSAYIRQLAVAPDKWGKGLGRALTFAVLKDAAVRHLYLVTRRVNQIGLGFYEHLGFKQSKCTHEGLDAEKYAGYEWHDPAA